MRLKTLCLEVFLVSTLVGGWPQSASGQLPDVAGRVESVGGLSAIGSAPDGALGSLFNAFWTRARILEALSEFQLRLGVDYAGVREGVDAAPGGARLFRALTLLTVLSGEDGLTHLAEIATDPSVAESVRSEASGWLAARDRSSASGWRAAYLAWRRGEEAIDPPECPTRAIPCLQLRRLLEGSAESLWTMQQQVLSTPGVPLDGLPCERGGEATYCDPIALELAAATDFYLAVTVLRALPNPPTELEFLALVGARRFNEARDLYPQIRDPSVRLQAKQASIRPSGEAIEALRSLARATGDEAAWALEELARHENVAPPVRSLVGVELKAPQAACASTDCDRVGALVLAAINSGLASEALTLAEWRFRPTGTPERHRVIRSLARYAADIEPGLAREDLAYVADGLPLVAPLLGMLQELLADARTSSTQVRGGG